METQPDPPPLLLASASPRRAELLRQAGVRFSVRSCPFREPSSKPPTTSPSAWAEALAHFKARAVAERNSGRWVLGADTVVVCGGRLLGKPRDADEAREMLQLQAGRACEVITGVCLLRVADVSSRFLGHELTRVGMRDAPTEIEAYLAGGEWRGKAGAYGIQDVGDRLVERVQGSFSNVVGLPIERVRRLLAAADLLSPSGSGPARPAAAAGGGRKRTAAGSGD